MKSRSVIALIVSSTLLIYLTQLTSCTKHDPAPVNANAPAPDVYVGGTVYPSDQVGNSRIVYWKNGTVHSLALPAGGLNSSAISMSVLNKDVFILGSIGYPDSIYFAYWKNDSSPVISPYGFVPTCILAEGSDIYLGGGSDDGKVAIYLKNGVAVSLPGDHGRINSMAVANGVVYAAGSIQVDSAGFAVSQATLWVNGTASSLGWKRTIANAVDVSGSDVYVLGFDVGRAFLWKNGVQSRLLGPYPGSYTMGTGLAVSGKDVFVCGNNTSGVYWKDGVANAIYDDPTNPQFPLLNAISVQGSDVYVAGTTGAQPKPAYWKNGVQVDLPTTYVYGSPVGIFVQ